MPTSWFQAIPNIVSHILMEKPRTILDVGVGFGKYGLLAREVLELPYERYDKEDWVTTIDGVEAHEQYNNPIHAYAYNKIYYGDILELIDDLPKYDVILLIDVLEHFNKQDGSKLLRELLKHTNTSLIVSTPIFPEKQEEYLGNKFEAYKSRWIMTDFIEFDFSYQEIKIGDNGAYIIKFYPQKEAISFTIDDLILKNSLGYNLFPLTITYVLPHTNLTGGLKMLLEQMRQLKKRGHFIQAVAKGEIGQCVIPKWMNIEIDREIVVPKDDNILSYIDNSDVIMAGWCGQLEELENDSIPVLYWEQGHEWLFGDIPNQYSEKSIRRYLETNYSKNVTIASVSPIVSRILNARYNRKSLIIPNFIDTTFYYPLDSKDNTHTILLIGNPNLRFKGLDIAVSALNKVWYAGYQFKVNWVTPVPIEIQELSFPVNYIVSPSQGELAQIYRMSDIHLFSSWYEGFGMPPLEAMASGVPVVATKCGGIEAYAVHGENCLLVEPGDINAMAASIIYFLKNDSIRRTFAERGRQTAMQFDYSVGVQLLEECLFTLITNFKKMTN